MKLSDVMSTDVELANPSDSLQSVARRMADKNIGSLPVCDGHVLRGMVTDRDIAVRGVGAGLSTDTPISEVMSGKVTWCYDDEELKDVAAAMADKQIRRLPVLNRDKKLVGIVSLGDVALNDKEKRTGETLEQISKP